MAALVAVGDADRRPARTRTPQSSAPSAPPGEGPSTPPRADALGGLGTGIEAWFCTRRWSQGIATEQARQSLKPLTCAFAPPAGFEPATYGLEVDPRPSMPSRRVPFSLVRSGNPSR
jgi:hypothetical protein